ncbi:Multidrug resistance protein MdtG [uncultured archaeon]|nr:Multidrug resistance protein MdtG [uncultured archaeon]
MDILKGIKQNVLVLGVVSFLTDISSEMIFPILPIFLTTFLGAGTAIVGLIEGIADSLASLLDIFIGYWSDLKGDRKTFVTYGYGLSSISKIGFALASSWPVVLIFRGADRLGKSVRTSPRDAIIAASTDKSIRGKAFGLHRMMDTLGAIVGPLIVYFILTSMGSTESAYRTVFWVAVIPAFLAVAVILLFVREPKAAQVPQKKQKKHNFWQSLRILPANYKRYLYISCLFSLAYFSFALLIVRANDLGISASDILLIYVLYNIVYALASVPMGMLSDKIGRKAVIVGSFLLYALICVGFALATSLWQVALLFAVYGLFVSTDESVNKAYISDITEEKGRGTALGAYNSAVGAVYLPASVLFGALWAAAGAAVAFGAAAAVAAVAGIALFFYAE